MQTSVNARTSLKLSSSRHFKNISLGSVISDTATGTTALNEHIMLSIIVGLFIYLFFNKGGILFVSLMGNS